MITKRLAMPESQFYSKQYVKDVRELVFYDITEDDFYARWDVVKDGTLRTYSGHVPQTGGAIEDRLAKMRDSALEKVLGDQ